jgi:uncharacterized protein (UPF0262 family)
MVTTEPRIPKDQRIVQLELDACSIVRRKPQVEQERKTAIRDLLEENHFSPLGGFDGPFHLGLGLREGQLLFDIRDTEDVGLVCFGLGLRNFKKIIKDYFIVCDSYYKAIVASGPGQIEAMDMGRRGLHTEGGEMLRERLSGKADIDIETARRLFTLLCVLHIRL